MSDIETARKKIQQLVALGEDAWEDGSPEKAQAFSAAASVSAQIGDTSQALDLYERVAVMQRERLPTSAGDLMSTLNALASIQARAANFQGALRAMLELKNLIERHLPAHTDSLVSVMGNIAAMQLGLEDFASAERSYLDLIARAKAGDVRADSEAVFHENLGVLYAKTGRNSQAIECLELALVMKSTALGAKDPRVQATAQSLNNLKQRTQERAGDE